jgi:hypothetical protein
MPSFLTVAFMAMALISGSSVAKAQNILITEAEAQTPSLQVPTTRAITRGPGINLLTPSEVLAKSFTLKLVFQPRGGAKIDASSIKFEYLKQPIIDLTTRFRPGLSGNQLELAMVTVPAGKHPIRVSVRDSEGREGHTVIHLNAK